MNPQVAQLLLEEFGTLVLLGMPPGTEFGIDMNTWNVGEKFKGVKMIPPGLHFIYFSAVSRQGDTAPRTGFFHFFKQKDLVVRHYDAAAEDLKEEESNPDEMERIRVNLRNLDRYLGPYPMDSWEKWVSLVQYVKPDDLDRMMPLSGRVCSVPELIVVPEEQKQPGISSITSGGIKTPLSNSVETSQKDSSISHQDDVVSKTSCKDMPQESELQKSDDAGDDEHTKTPVRSMPEMVPRPGTELRFSKFPSRPYREGATPAEITRYSIDSSYSVGKIVESLGRPERLLAELQLAFVCFLTGQVWDGWEHWRLLLTSLCSAEELLLEQHQIYLTLLSIIHFQMQEVPEDLFVDIVESNNFLATALKVLFSNIMDNSSALPISLVTKAQRFKHHLSTKFGWNLTIEDEGEDAPVVIETEDLPACDST